MQALEQANAQHDMNRSLLRITYILQQRTFAVECALACSVLIKPDFLPELDTKTTQSTIELLLTQPSLLEALRKAHMGNYGAILSLLGCLEHGIKAKKLVDKVIDVCTSSTPSSHLCDTAKWLMDIQVTMW